MIFAAAYRLEYRSFGPKHFEFNKQFSLALGACDLGFKLDIRVTTLDMGQVPKVATVKPINLFGKHMLACMRGCIRKACRTAWRSVTNACPNLESMAKIPVMTQCIGWYIAILLAVNILQEFTCSYQHYTWWLTVEQSLISNHIKLKNRSFNLITDIVQIRLERSQTKFWKAPSSRVHLFICLSGLLDFEWLCLGPSSLHAPVKDFRFAINLL